MCFDAIDQTNLSLNLAQAQIKTGVDGTIVGNAKLKNLEIKAMKPWLLIGGVG